MTPIERALPDGLLLTAGKHNPDSQYCLMEAVAWVAGEEWSDTPTCACHVASAFASRLNDARWSNDKTRTDALLPLVPLLITSKATKKVEKRRAFFFADRAVRLFAPIALRARGKEDVAARLESLPPIVDYKTAAAAYAAAAAANTAAAAYAAAAAANTAAAAYNTAAAADAAAAYAAADAAANTAAAADAAAAYAAADADAAAAYAAADAAANTAAAADAAAAYAAAAYAAAAYAAADADAVLIQAANVLREALEIW